jgi:hypothetical protein
MGKRIFFFRVLYRSLYLLLYVFLIALLIITPLDIIIRSIRSGQSYNIQILAVCYIVTFLILAFIFAVRLYVNKSVMASIPKRWVPIERSDVGKAVYRMIQAGLDRSATIAYEARPRVQPKNDQQDQHHDQAPTTLRLTKTRTGTGNLDAILVLPSREMWADIEHPGWASPNSPDLPSLHYITVISELPNLIEAKALTLAPADPYSGSDPPILDEEAVAMLQRQPNMSLRSYLEHLGDLAVLESGSTVANFLTQYEYARFSAKPITSAPFRELMHLFAEILRSMKPLDLEALDLAADDDGDGATETATESDIDNDAPAGTGPSSPGGSLARSLTVSTQSSIRRPPRTPSANTWRNYRTAPTTPRSRRAEMASRQSSSSSSNVSRAARLAPLRQPSNSSLRSTTSDSRSIIRLATHEDLDELPFVLSLRDTARSF